MQLENKEKTMFAKYFFKVSISVFFSVQFISFACQKQEKVEEPESVSEEVEAIEEELDAKE